MQEMTPLPPKKKIGYTLFFFAALFALAEAVACLISSRGAPFFCERVVISQRLTRFKPKGEYRIFLFGESTMHGAFLYPHATLDVWLQQYLQDLLPPQRAQQIRIINFGRLGANSDFIYEAFRDTLQYHPDLAVFYFGHNDPTFPENRQALQKPPSARKWLGAAANQLIRKSCFLSSINRLFVKLRVERHERRDRQKAEEFEEKFFRTIDPQTDLLVLGSDLHKTVFGHLKSNIEKLVGLGQKRGVRIVFFKIISNVKDFEPQWSVHINPLTERELKRWEGLYAQQHAWMKQERFEEALPLLKQMLDIDPTYAEILYTTATCFYQTGHYETAKEFFYKAMDYDLFPTRGPSQVNQIYDDVEKGHATHVAVVDTPRLFEERSAHHIIADDLIDDFLHPNLEGYALMAKTVLKTMEGRGWGVAQGELRWEKEKPFDEMVGRLSLAEDFLFRYYLKTGEFSGRYLHNWIKMTKKALTLKPESTLAKRQLAWAYWLQGNREDAKKIYLELEQYSPPTLRDIYRRIPAIKAYLKERQAH